MPSAILFISMISVVNSDVLLLLVVICNWPIAIHTLETENIKKYLCI